MLSLLILSVLATSALAHHEMGHELRAITRISDPRGDVQGNLTFTQLADGKVHLEGTILGLSHGKYGFHVHEKGDVTGGCLSTGGHFNPEHKPHGHPNDIERHVGDLGNLEFDENRIGRIDFVDNQISLVGPHSIIGRAVVLHEREDDFGRSAHPDSKKTGNAGGRVACGVIGILEPIEGWSVNGVASTSSGMILMVLAPAYLVLSLANY